MRLQLGPWSFDNAGWAVEDEDGVVSLIAGDIDAALQFSGMSKPGDTILPEEIRRRAAGLVGPAATLEEVHAPGHRGYTARFIDPAERLYWRYWFLFAGSSHLLVTYNCPAAKEGAHDGVTDWIVSTLDFDEALPDA